MTNQDIKDLISCFEGSSLQSMKLATQEFTIELSRGAGTAASPTAPVPVPAPKGDISPAGSTVNAPLVGTFYAAPAPDKPPFVAQGQRVKKGETLCLIEAMKMMSEIPAPCDCVIEAVLKTSGDLVSFGEPLLRYTPC